MATKNVESTDNKGQMSQNDDLYPDMIVEEEFVDVYITDADIDDLDEMDYPAGTSAQPGETTKSGKSAQPAKSAKTTQSAKSSSAKSPSATKKALDKKTEKVSAETKKHGASDSKKKKDPDVGDGLSIEDIDDEVVAQTNELIKEKKAERKGNCGCGC